MSLFIFHLLLLFWFPLFLRISNSNHRSSRFNCLYNCKITIYNFWKILETTLWRGSIEMQILFISKILFASQSPTPRELFSANERYIECCSVGQSFLMHRPLFRITPDGFTGKYIRDRWKVRNWAKSHRLGTEWPIAGEISNVETGGELIFHT